MGMIYSEIGHLPQSMNTGIGASGSIKSNFLSGNFGDSFFDLPLKGQTVGLVLPAGKFGTVVLYIQPDVFVSQNLYPGKDKCYNGKNRCKSYKYKI